MKKLEIFGDSVLRGVLLGETDGRYHLCSDSKFDSIKSDGVAVSNNCKMGATVIKGEEILNKKLSALGEGTLVITEFGSNDCDYNWQEISDNPHGKFLPRTEEKTFCGKYREIISRIKSTGADVAVSTLVPIDSQKYMKFISRGKSYENILTWLGYVEKLGEWQAHYNRLVKQIAKECGCPTIDLRQAFLDAGDYKKLLSADGIHPTEEGHRVLHLAVKKYVLG